MIFVARTTEPGILKKNKTQWLLSYENAIINYNINPSPANKKKVTNAENKYKHAEIKKSLKGMFFDKCAYCESYIGHISYGHIEHFKPKTTYPKQCFNWKNMLLGCEVCNGSNYKGTKFPLTTNNGPFVDPTTENPDTFFLFEYDPATGTANVLGINTRGNTTEKLLGLNRPELVKHRSRIVRRMAFLSIKASQGDKDALKEMRDHIQADEEYSSFAIQLFKKFKLI